MMPLSERWYLAGVLLASLGLPTKSLAQPGFAPGARQIFALDLANTPVGEIPTSIKLLQGTLEVVIKDGIPMLKASSVAEFLIPLAQPLPQDFTLEFDLVPKACCNPSDLAIGEVNQGVASAHIQWDSDGQLMVVGGAAEMYQAPMPEDFKAALPGVRTQVVVTFAGSTVKVYTNGRRLFTLDRQFARKRELRVSLGGQDDGAHAVYLAGLRIAAGVVPPTAVASVPTPPPGQPSTVPPSGQPPVPPPSQPPPPAQPPPAPMPPAPAPTGTPTPRTAPATSSGPVTTATTTVRNIAACTPGPATAPAPQMFRAFGLRVGGAPLEWLNEPNTRYVVERAPAPQTLVPGATVSWTLLTSTCDPASNFVAGQSGLDEQTMTSHPILQFDDIYPGVQLGGAYQYRLTRIQSDGTSGSDIVYWEAPTARFELGPTGSVNGHTVTLSTGISFCQAFNERCDPWMVEFTVTSSTSGYTYSTRQAWRDSYDPNIPGSVEASFSFAIAGVPSGTHAFTVTALYQPDHRLTAGVVTVVVP